MSGVYIKGMEMTERCSQCRFLYGDTMDGLCSAAEKWLDDDDYWTWFAYNEGDVDTSKPANCPLIPVPEHGRLIDADALRAKMYHEAFETDTPMQKWDSGCWIRYKMFENAEKTAPTVIEADKEVEG